MGPPFHSSRNWLSVDFRGLSGKKKAHSENSCGNSPFLLHRKPQQTASRARTRLTPDQSSDKKLGSDPHPREMQ